MLSRLNRFTRAALFRSPNSFVKGALPVASRVAFFSSEATAPASAKESGRPVSRLLRQLSSELTAQETLIQDAGDDLNPSAILNEFSDFLEAGAWKVEHESGSALLTVSRNDEQLKGTVSISVDMNEVVNSSAFDSHEDAFPGEDAVQEGEAAGESESEFGNYASFPVVVEVSRDGKTLAFECLAEQADDSSTLSVENVSFTKGTSDSAYQGPVYEQLDEELKEAFDQFVAKMVKPEEMLDFIQIYSQAAEAHEYKNWLQSVKSILN